MKGNISNTGYKKNSPDRNNDFNIIPSNTITMRDVSHLVLGIDDMGNQQLMAPGKDYKFPGTKVLEIPVKNNRMKKTPQIENFQDLLNLMAEGGPIVLQYPVDRMLPMAQNGKAVTIPASGNPRGATTNVDLTAPINFNMDPTQLPKDLNPASYNTFQSWLTKQKIEGQPFVNNPVLNTPEGREKWTNWAIEEYNKGPNIQKFPQNKITPEIIESVQKYHKLSDPNVQVDKWVGSQTSRMRLPQPEVRYNQNVPLDTNSFLPVLYGNKSYVLPASKYAKGQTPQLADMMPYDPAAHSAKLLSYPDPNVMARFPAQAAGTSTVRKLGGAPFTKGALKNVLEQVMKKQFGGSTAPQGVDINSYVADKQKTFANYLKKNTIGHMMGEELNGIMNNGGQFYQDGGETPDMLPMNMATLPEPMIGDEDIMASNLNVPAQNVIKNMQTNFLTNIDEAERKKANRSNAIATGIKGAMDTFSNVMEQSRAKAYERKAEEEARTRALTASVSGGRGDFDVNDFSFRPNQVGMPTYKLGGSYQMTREEINQFIAMGGQIKLID